MEKTKVKNLETKQKQKYNENIELFSMSSSSPTKRPPCLSAKREDIEILLLF